MRESNAFTALIGIIFALLLQVSCNDPPEINIGGLFDPFLPTGEVDLTQVENLAAFLMAVREINDKSDGMWDDILPNTQLKVVVREGFGLEGAFRATIDLIEAFEGAGVTGIVGSLPSTETEASNRMAIDRKIPQVHSMASSTDLGMGLLHYPFKSQTNPIDSYEGMVLQSLMCNYFGIKKLALLYTLDNNGIFSAKEAQDGAFCSLDLLNLIGINSLTQEDFSQEISDLKTSGARYFGLFVSALEAARFIEQGHASGLLGKDTIVLCPKSVSDEVVSHFSPGADVASLMRGYFGMEYWPTFPFENKNEMSVDFAKRWRLQPSTLPLSPGSGCNNATDDDAHHYVYRDQKHPSRCAGLDFSGYHCGGF